MPRSLLTMVLLATACASGAAQVTEPTAPASPKSASTTRTAVAATEPPPRLHSQPDPDPEPTVLISDPAALAALDLEFGPTVFGLDATSTLELRKSRSFRELAHTLAWVGARKRWLRNTNTRFELAAVVNRLDRMDVMPGTCGETRLVYRLVQETDEGATRVLPLGLNVLFVQQASEDGCAAVAQSWQTEDIQTLTQGDGPLSASKLALEYQHAIESNLRETDERGSSNSLRIHQRVLGARWDQSQWKEGTLEFSPQAMYKGRGWARVTELLTEPAMREAIHQGTPTTHERSIPYPNWDSTAFDSWGRVGTLLPEDGDYAPFETKEAFLERGRSLTCGGCHDTRAVEGFHASREPSAHLLDEVPWRVAYVQAVAQGKEPNRVRGSVYGED